MLLVFITLTSLFAIPSYGANQCFVPGECVGHNPFFILVNYTVERCIANCWKTVFCRWSTFDPTNNHCLLFSSLCENFDVEKCPLCLGNEKDCIDSKYHSLQKAMHYLK